MLECPGGANHPGGVHHHGEERFPHLVGVYLHNRLPKPRGSSVRRGHHAFPQTVWSQRIGSLEGCANRVNHYQEDQQHLLRKRRPRTHGGKDNDLIQAEIWHQRGKQQQVERSGVRGQLRIAVLRGAWLCKLALVERCSGGREESLLVSQVRGESLLVKSCVQMEHRGTRMAKWCWRHRSQVSVRRISEHVPCYGGACTLLCQAMNYTESLQLILDQTEMPAVRHCNNRYIKTNGK